MSDAYGRAREVLGVDADASAAEIKQAYRDLARIWHPDRFAQDPRLQAKAQEQFKVVNEAYAVLRSGRPAGRPGDQGEGTVGQATRQSAAPSSPVGRAQPRTRQFSWLNSRAAVCLGAVLAMGLTLNPLIAGINR
jgi:curved DNA-binding protein CbpA